MSVPTMNDFVPTVPTVVGYKKTADFCGVEPSVPTVPTYIYIFIIKVVAAGHGFTATKLSASRWERYFADASKAMFSAGLRPFPPYRSRPSFLVGTAA